MIGLKRQEITGISLFITKLYNIARLLTSLYRDDIREWLQVSEYLIFEILIFS